MTSGAPRFRPLLVAVSAHRGPDARYAREERDLSRATSWGKRVRVWVVALALAAFAAGNVQADEGMWTLDNPPLKTLEEKYGFEPTRAWLDHVRAASVRFVEAQHLGSHQLEFTHAGDPFEVPVRCEQAAIMPDRGRGDLTVGRRHAHALGGAAAMQGRSVDVVRALECQQWEGLEMPDDRSKRGLRAERLEHLLEDEAADEHVLVGAEEGGEATDRRMIGEALLSKGERPNGRVDEDSHPRRLRSAL